MFGVNVTFLSFCSLIFFYTKSIWNTEVKSSQISKKLNHLDHIKWHRRCKISDFLVDKYKKLLYLKKHKIFLKRFSIIILQILAKKVYSRYFLAGTVG